jgi:D-alanyl-D-alanine carboxypeptidase
MLTLNRRWQSFLICIALASAGGVSLAQQGPLRGGPHDARNASGSVAVNASMEAGVLERALDAHLAKMTDEDRFSGVVLVAKNGRPVFQKAYGMADRANKRPNDMRTRFNLGSLNKTFTNLAIDQLVAQHKLSYSDTIGNILPDYPQAESLGATVEQLMRMTAGLTDLHGPEHMATDKGSFRSNADYYDFIGKLPPLFPPGERQQHCNGCFIVLGEMIERLSQMPYEQYMAENVFKPAGMKVTGFAHQDAIEPNVAIGYTRQGSETLRNNVFMHGAAGSAAGGGYSTAADLLSFVNSTRKDVPPGAPGSGIHAIGGFPGVSTTIQSDGVWTVIVLANLDPPAGASVGTRIFEALSGRR